jgi:hypothetical protein
MQPSFKFQTPRKRQEQSLPPSIKVGKEPEGLTGYIVGGDGRPRKASQPEERLANAAIRYAPFWFDVDLNGYPGDPGHKTLDFLFFLRGGDYLAVEVDETSFIHRGELAGQDPDDLLRLDGLRKWGIDLTEVIHVDADRLIDKQTAERTARELLR